MQWSAPQAEAALLAAREFWHEAPEVTPETRSLALQHGIDPARPLEARLPTDLLARVRATVAELGIAMELLAGMRPWLAAQVLRMAADARRGLDRATAPEDVFRARAAHARIPIRTEFATVAALVELFGALPEQAEVELLALELDGIQTSVDEEQRRAERWLDGDLAYEERNAARTQRDYPAFYEHLGPARNRAWVPRIGEMLRSETPAFIVVGVGHMVGPDSLHDLLKQAGIQIQRV
jgi:uncharacterized protein YbaP (TraB family)